MILSVKALEVQQKTFLVDLVQLKTHLYLNSPNTTVISNQCKKLLSLKHSVRATQVMPFTQQKSLCDPMMCKRPDVPLQTGLLALTIQLRTSQPSILAVLHELEY